MESWPAYLWYESGYVVCNSLMTLAFSFRVDGKANIPRTGPALLIANHQSYLDPVIVGLASRRHLAFLARKTLFRHKGFRWLIESLNAVPIDQEGIGKEGIKTILEEMKKGRAVVVYPEGERTGHGGLNPLKPGIQLLIKRTQAPIVPIGIAGAFDALPRWRKFPRFSPLFLPAQKGAIAVAVGKPLDGKHYADMPREQVLAELTAVLQKVCARAEQLRRKP
jgi:1-acyl-sn-glycerol-3-phosphate acyltransferase